MPLPLEATSDPRRTPCHFAPVTGGPAVVWCTLCSASYHADAPELLILELLARAAAGTDFTPPHSLPRPGLHLVHDARGAGRKS
jgi:hypothetical protein